MNTHEAMRSTIAAAPLSVLLTLDRQRAGMLAQMGACSQAAALETVEEILSDALEYAHYQGPFYMMAQEATR